MSEDERAIIAKRLDEGGVRPDCFVDVHDGEKGTDDHTTYEPDAVSGNYGIYATAEDPLVILDIDDYDDLDDKSGLTEVLTRLPPTLEQKSPHGGTHRFYAVDLRSDGLMVAEVFEEELGVKNPNPTWGEVRAANQYVVGAGSELNGCDKEWCEECATEDGGCYELKADREIATIQPEEIVDVLLEDPNYQEEEQESFGGDVDSDADAEEILKYALKESDDGKLQRLWRGDYSDYGGDRSRAEAALAAKLAFWLGHDRTQIETKNLVEDALNGRLTPSGVSSPNVEKWEQRDDDAYRNSVLQAVEQVTDFFEPGSWNRRDYDRIEDVLEERAGQSGWDDVRNLYEDDDVPRRDARYAATQKLEQDFDFATPTHTEHLMVYNEELGVYERGGRLEVERELRRGLGPHFSMHEVREIVGQLKAATYVDMDVFDAGEHEAKLLAVKNGVLDLDTRELHDHAPEYYFRSRLPVEYDPDAECPAVEQFMEDITSREADRKTMYEMVGNALWPNYDHAAFGVIFGPGGNGKSTFFELVENLIGTENVSGWGLKDLEENRFATANLVDKMANIAPDLEGKKIRDLGTLKALTGGDTVMAERKGEQAFEFENRAMMMFGANKPPVLGERTDAVKRRLLPIHLPHRFTPDPDDEHKQARDRNELMEELTTEEELSGFLNKALDGLERLNDNGDFSLPEGPDERLELYEKHSDPIKEFRVTCLENQDGEIVPKDAIYNAYKRFCERNDHTVADKNVFFRQLRQTTLTYEERQISMPDGSRPRHLEAVKFTETGLEYCPDSVLKRLDAEVEEDDEDGEDPSSTVWDAKPVAEVAQDPTGYGTVTVKVLTVDRPSSEDAPAMRATVKDTSSAVDVVSWDDPDALEEGDIVGIRNAEIGEYQGKTQLTIRDGVTVVTDIHAGVGYTEGEGPPEGQASIADAEDAQAAADGGEQTAPAKADEQTTATVQEHLRKLDAGQEVSVPTVAGALDEDPDEVRTALEKLAEQGRGVTRTGSEGGEFEAL